ncbi:acetate/propionate family kinase [Chitinimonas lacunae]|uniref:Acetate kinase n=1 Tax=Chitinimonas lacunae TaxID=1963018 RepID=A0ABV8MPY2_9NEIS
MTILTLNAGSATLKFAAYFDDGERPLLHGQIEHLGPSTSDPPPRFYACRADGQHLLETVLPQRDPETALHHLAAWLETEVSSVTAVSHRIVHGGPRYSRPTLLDDEAFDYLEGLVPLAPLHQPHGLAGARILQQQLPQARHLACFDTAFHRTQSELQQRYALPEELFRLGIRRYGFHGLSYQYVAEQLPQVLGERIGRGRVIIVHLGNGASACAVVNGRSIASSMGFTALEGLMMGSRCGRIDPGVLLYLQDSLDFSSADIADLLYRRSGLLGVSGISHDMRQLQASAHPAARRAVELFCLMAAREIASLVVSSGGIDALVFTAGIGEHSALVRAGIVERLEWLGFRLDPEANHQTIATTSCISDPGSQPSLWVIPTNEEAMLARQAARWLEEHQSA